MLSSAVHWLEFLPPESLAVCQYVCPALREAANEDRLWKEACSRRWTKVNARSDGYQRSYASLNGWRIPRFRRTILSTTGPSRTRASHAAANGANARNISALDVGLSKVVVCSADTAWYYRPSSSRLSASSSSTDDPRDTDPNTRDAKNGGGHHYDGSNTVADGAHENAGVQGNSIEPALWGWRLVGWNVTEARLSRDEERCFFGTVSGQIFVDARVCGWDGQSVRRQRRPTVSNTLASSNGSPLPVRQIVSNFEGGSASGAKLGVLCRSSAGWQPDLDGFGGGGYLFITDTEAQATTRTMRFSDGVLAGEKFPCMVRGGASVSVAPVSTSGGCMPPEGEGGGGEIFAVGFSGGAVALLDGRCGEQGGIVGGFVAMHRWLERIRCAGSLLMASYGRCSEIETWDVRRLPSPSDSNRLDGLSPRPPPQRVADLSCAGKSPDFWVEPHGLTVAVFGAPRNSQRFGARYSFFGWPRVSDMLSFSQPAPQLPPPPPPRSAMFPSIINPSHEQRQRKDPLNFTRRRDGGVGGGAGVTGGGACPGAGGGAGDARCYVASGGSEGRGQGVARSGDRSAGETGDAAGGKGWNSSGENAAEVSRAQALQAFASAGAGVPRRVGVELAVPGVVNESDYRMRLSTGIKFCDTHMATVLDEKRVLVDELVVGGFAAGASDRGSQEVGSVHLSAQHVEVMA